MKIPYTQNSSISDPTRLASQARGPLEATISLMLSKFPVCIYTV